MDEHLTPEELDQLLESRRWKKPPNKHRGEPEVEGDLREFGPTHQCLCGSRMFVCYIQFEDYEPSWWGLDARCADCGVLVKVPCPADKEESL